MEKTKKLLYLIIFILIGFILLSNKGIVLDNTKIVLKNMDESTQVNDLQKAIDDLNASKTEYEKYITTSKTNLATAITNAGVTTKGTDSFETMIANVSNILTNKTNDATATDSQILTGQTAYVKGSKVTGSMANNGAVTKTLNGGESYTIPAGYHNGSGKVTANSLASQTQATATANNISEGKTAWVNGTLITGDGSDNAAYVFDGGRVIYDNGTFEEGISCVVGRFGAASSNPSGFENIVGWDVNTSLAGRYVSTDIAIDITKYSKLIFDYTTSGNANGRAYFGLSTTSTLNSSSKVKAIIGIYSNGVTGNSIGVIDISQYSGEYYIAAGAYAGGSSTGQTTLKITKIRLI